MSATITHLHAEQVTFKKGMRLLSVDGSPSGHQLAPEDPNTGCRILKIERQENSDGAWLDYFVYMGGRIVNMSMHRLAQVMVVA